ncbi:replication factor C subunit 2/4 [Chaetoceros tenuissimus]|uniref:Replication factor C subunit 2/4 n=1 Tax=Chaetoceros tenuissimus TaxID=426638 RepID=A0AAD3DAY8_9STRA|nr:replication factor C subunit 2/4 [Chaetoceros tenuissimus]
MSLSEATPWVEKYRPKKLTEVSHQNEVVSTLQNAVSTNRLPHLLLYGPPGTGKTSVALALCKTLWHPSQYSKRVLELNASDERGISVVREKIKHFASLAVSNAPNPNARKNFFGKQDVEMKEPDEEPEDEYPNPPFKVIILDEADTVTPDAQAALRRIIEAHSKITRFILICNYVTRIIEPLASRCAKFRFQSLPPQSMLNRLKFIGEAEGVQYANADEVLGEILDKAQGDMRRAVTTLQSAHMLSGKKIIQKDDIAEMAGLPPSNVCQELMNIFQDPKSNFGTMEKAVQNCLMEGYAAQYIMKDLLNRVMVLDDKILKELHKANIAIKIAEADKCLVDSADEGLQLLMVCSLILKCFKNN